MNNIDWDILKAFTTARGASLHYVDLGDKYWLKSFDSLFSIECFLSKSNADVSDFETNFKPTANAKGFSSISVQAAPAFGSKTVVINGVTKKLYARNHGIQQALSAGSNTVSYTIIEAWVKMIGVEVVNSESLDYVDLKVKDNSSGTYSGVPNYVLNQFAYSHNIPKDYYIRTAQFDADIYVGMVIEVTYTSISAKTIGLNFIMNEVKT